MNLGRKKYRKPASYLKYLNSSGNYEYYQITKQGFRKIDFSLYSTSNRQSNLNDSNFNQSKNENDMNIQIDSSEFSDNYFNVQLNISDEPKEKINQSNEEGLIYDNSNNKNNFINLRPNYIETPHTLPQINLTTEQPNYNNASTILSECPSGYPTNNPVQIATEANNTQNQNCNISNNEKIENLNHQFNSTNNHIVNQSIISSPQSELIENLTSHTENQSNYNNQPDLGTSLHDQSLYEKIMDDKINLVLQECHLIKPDSVLAIYKIVPE